MTSTRELMLAMLYAPTKKGDYGAPIMGITRAVKLAFLAERYEDLQPIFAEMDFRADNFGPYSDAVPDALEALENLNLVTVTEIPNARQVFDDSSAGQQIESSTPIRSYEDLGIQTRVPRRYELTDLGQRIAKKLVDKMDEGEWNAIRDIKHRFGTMPLSDLVGYVYRTSKPFWTAESLIANRYW